VKESRRRKGRGRRAGTTGQSRDAILGAARDLFARRGFRGTTIRAIAKQADVDTALVHYFFGSKPKLFAAVVEPPIRPARLTGLLARGPGSPGERMARHYLEHLFPEQRETITAMLRAGLGDPGSVPALRALIERSLVAAVAGVLPAKDARLRAELAGAQMVGLFISRCVVGVEPLASAPTGEIVALLAPALDALLGPTAAPAPPARAR
jgi:AcrR family transcriptional regulator